MTYPRIGQLRGRGAPLRIPHPIGNPVPSYCSTIWRRKKNVTSITKVNLHVYSETNIQSRSRAGGEGLNEFGSGWGNNIVSRNMACDGQEMEDHSVMTPPFSLWSDKEREDVVIGRNCAPRENP